MQAPEIERGRGGVWRLPSAIAVIGLLLACLTSITFGSTKRILIVSDSLAADATVTNGTYNYDAGSQPSLETSSASIATEPDSQSPRSTAVAPQLRAQSAIGFVAEAGETAAVNGETAATAYGRLMHQTYDYGPGFEREFTLDSGRRVDAINFETREVLELKPNNPRAIRLGNQQLEDYLAELNELFPDGGPWTGKVVTYDRP